MRRRILTAVVMALLVSACANTKPTENAGNSDPIERINRGTYAFNSFFDRILFKHIAKGYNHLPKPMRLGIGNFFSNLGTPVDIINNLLQGKPKAAGVETGRLLLNSTMGLGGLFDPASEVGLKEHSEDFGQTLGAWGASPGPYIVLPLLGPSSLRDGPAQIVDFATHPLLYYDNSSVRDKLSILLSIDRRAGLLSAEKALEDAYDEYAFVRDAYLQRRRFLVYDGDPPDEDFEDDFEEEDLSEFE